MINPTQYHYVFRINIHDLLCQEVLNGSEKSIDNPTNLVFMDMIFPILVSRIDASVKDSCLARWVNDEHISPNCAMKKVVLKQSNDHRKPHLCLFASVDIQTGVELRYDYGLDDYPWRQVCHLFLLLKLSI